MQTGPSSHFSATRRRREQTPIPKEYREHWPAKEFLPLYPSDRLTFWDPSGFSYNRRFRQPFRQQSAQIHTFRSSRTTLHPFLPPLGSRSVPYTRLAFRRFCIVRSTATPTALLGPK